MADPFSNASINPGVDMSDVNGVFASRMQALINAAESATGQTVTVNSGYRSPEEQAQIYANTYYRDPAHPFVYKGVTYKVTGPSSRIVAPPGSSQHQQGFAVDIRPSGAAYKWMTQNAAKYGVEWGGNWKGNQNDPPHFQLPRADNVAALSGKLPPVNVPEVASAFANVPPPAPKADPRSSALTAISNATTPQPTQMGAGENLAFDRSNALAGIAMPALFPDGQLGTLNAQPPAMDAGYNPATGQVQPYANDPNILAAMGGGSTQQVVPPNLIQGSFDAIEAMKNRGMTPDGAVGSPPSLLNWFANQNRIPFASAAPAAGASGVGSAQVSSPSALPTSPVYAAANDVANFPPTGPVPLAAFQTKQGGVNVNQTHGYASPPPVYSSLDDVASFSPTSAALPPLPRADPRAYSSLNDVATFGPTSQGLPPDYASLNDVASVGGTGPVPLAPIQTKQGAVDINQSHPLAGYLPPLPMADPRGAYIPPAPVPTVVVNGHTYQVGQIVTGSDGKGGTIAYKVQPDGRFVKAVTMPTGGVAGGLVQAGLANVGSQIAASAPSAIASAGSALGGIFGNLFGTSGGGHPVPPMDVPIPQRTSTPSQPAPYSGYIPGQGNSSPVGGSYNNIDAAATPSQGSPYAGYIPGYNGGGTASVAPDIVDSSLYTPAAPTYKTVTSTVPNPAYAAALADLNKYKPIPGQGDVTASSNYGAPGYSGFDAYSPNTSLPPATIQVTKKVLVPPTPQTQAQMLGRGTYAAPNPVQTWAANTRLGKIGTGLFGDGTSQVGGAPNSGGLLGFIGGLLNPPRINGGYGSVPSTPLSAVFAALSPSQQRNVSPGAALALANNQNSYMSGNTLMPTVDINGNIRNSYGDSRMAGVGSVQGGQLSVGGGYAPLNG